MTLKIIFPRAKELQAQLDARQLQYNGTARAYNELCAQVGSLKNRLTLRDVELRDKDAIIFLKEQRLAKLRTQVNSLIAECGDMERQRIVNQAEVDYLTRHMNARAEVIKGLQDVVKDRDKHLGEALAVTAQLRLEVKDLLDKNDKLVAIATRLNEQLNKLWLGMAMTDPRSI